MNSTNSKNTDTQTKRSIKNTWVNKKDLDYFVNQNSLWLNPVAALNLKGNANSKINGLESFMINLNYLSYNHSL